MNNVSCQFSDSNLPKRVTRQGVLICAVSSLFFFYEFFQMNMIGAMAGPLRQSFMLTATQLSDLSAYYFLSNVMCIPFAGLILDRYSVRSCILWSLGLCVVGVFLLSYAPSLWVAKCARFMTGVGGGFCFLSCIRLATLWLPEKHMALATGLLAAVAMLGGIVAQTPLTWLVLHSGWRMATLVDAGMGIAVLLLIFLFVQDPRVLCGRSSQVKSVYPFWRSCRLAFLSWRNWRTGLYAGLLNLPLIILGGLVGISYLMRHSHLAQHEASHVTSMLFMGMLLGAPCMGALSDRLGKRRAVMCGGAVASLILLLLLLLLLDWHYVGLCILFMALGFASGAQVIAYPTVAATNPPELTAASVSVVSMSCIGLGAVFEPVFGRLLDWHWLRHPATLTVNHARLYSATDYHFAVSSLLVAVALSVVLSLSVRVAGDS